MPDTPTDWPALVDELNRLLRLKTTPIGMKLFERVEDMQAIPKTPPPERHPHHRPDRRAGGAAGLHRRHHARRPGRRAVRRGHRPAPAGRRMAVRARPWPACGSPPSRTRPRTSARWSVVPHGKYKAMAVSPLASGRLDPPDICLVYATPGQMILLINGLQWAGYERFDWSVVGESSCADSWGRALATGKASLSIPCYAERRYGGVLDDELLMALPPADLPKAIAGMQALAENGLRYPIPQYGIQADARAGLGASYPSKAAG